MDVADLKVVVGNIAVKVPRSPFSYRPNKHTVCVSTPWKPLINTYLVRPNLRLHLMQELRCQATVGLTSWKVDGTEKKLAIWVVCKEIVHHSITVIPTIKCILCNAFVGAFNRK